MTFAESLKKEIARIARKELRDEIAALRKSSQGHRSEIAVLKKQIKAMQTQVNKLGKLPYSTASKKPSAKVSSPSEHVDVRVKPGRKVVFTADRLKTQRARLGFTQEQMGQLLEVSALSIWKWESGGAAPRASRVPAILQKLSLSKREALALVTSKVD